MVSNEEFGTPSMGHKVKMEKKKKVLQWAIKDKRQALTSVLKVWTMSKYVPVISLEMDIELRFCVKHLNPGSKIIQT